MIACEADWKLNEQDSVTRRAMSKQGSVRMKWALAETSWIWDMRKESGQSHETDPRGLTVPNRRNGRRIPLQTCSKTTASLPAASIVMDQIGRIAELLVLL
jgi:hypothetical protein